MLRIAFDGPEGCGKEEQAWLLRCRLAREFPDLTDWEITVLDRSILTDVVAKPGMEVAADQVADYTFLLAVGQEPERVNRDYYLAWWELHACFPAGLYGITDPTGTMTPETMHEIAWGKVREPLKEWYSDTHSQTPEGAGRLQKERVY